jgi:hypothetical protein
MRVPHASLHNTRDRKSYKPRLADPDAADWVLMRAGSRRVFVANWPLGMDGVLAHVATQSPYGRGRDEDFSSPPAQIPASAANAPGSSLGSNVGGAHGLKPHALRRTAANRIDVAARLSVRTTAACRLFPSGEALPSTTSAGSCLPLFGRFLGTTTSSDFSPAYMLGVRLLPSRAGPAHVRARMRPPRFRAKNFPTCTRSPTARGSCHASQYAMEDVAFSFSE